MFTRKRKGDDITDTQKFTTKDMPKAERRKLNVGDIWANQVKCLDCLDVIRSKNVHHYATCSCGSISVDGGSWYLKRVGSGEYEEQSEMYDDVQSNK